MVKDVREFDNLPSLIRECVMYWLRVYIGVVRFAWFIVIGASTRTPIRTMIELVRDGIADDDFAGTYTKESAS